MGRFVSSDTVYDEDAGPQGYNLFVYCGSNPVNRIDICGTDSDKLDDDMVDDDLEERGGGGNGYPKTVGGTTTLYRSVSDAEALDIKTTGRFSLAPGGMESKQFGLDYNETKQFGNWAGQEHIATVTVQSSMIDLCYKGTVDSSIFRSGTVTVYAEQMAAFNAAIVGKITLLR